MKIQVFSDIHVECRADKSFQIPYSNSDLVVLAGDIGEGLLGITWAADQSQRLGKPVLYTAGNHEYYHHDITRHDDAMRRHAEQLGVVLDFPDFARHQIALKCNSMRGVYEQREALPRRIQSRGGQAGY